jgi:cyanophycin synthetase
VSGDHLDLQGLHTLPELAEVKSVITRVTKPRGAVVLNADDDLVAATGKRASAPVWLFSLKPRSARVHRHVARGGRAYVLSEDGWLVELEGDKARRLIRAADIPATVGGLARHNVANALAAAGGARALGFTIAQVRAGLGDVRNSMDLLPGRLNVFRLGNRLVIIDYAHNVAGLEVLMDTAEALIGRRGRRGATLSVLIGSAGDRPDDYLRAMAAMAGSRADEVAIREGIPYLRGRTRESVIGELREGLRSAGVASTSVPVYHDEVAGVRGELTTPGRLAAITDGSPRVFVAMCHRLRDEVHDVLIGLGGQAVEDASQVAELRALMGAADERPPAARRARSQRRPAARTRRPARRSAS